MQLLFELLLVALDEICNSINELIRFFLPHQRLPGTTWASHSKSAAIANYPCPPIFGTLGATQVCPEPDSEPMPNTQDGMLSRKKQGCSILFSVTLSVILARAVVIALFLPVVPQDARSSMSVSCMTTYSTDTAENQEDKGSPLYSVNLKRHRFPVSSVGGITIYRSAYFGTLSIGTPATPFKMVFDTGSGYLILPSTYCKSETCRAHRRYRRSASATAKDIDYDGTVVLPGQPRNQITVSFGTGQVTGAFIDDVVCMPNERGNKSSSASQSVQTPAGRTTDTSENGCVRMRLIAATHMSEEPFKTFQFDGILGLGLEGLSQAREFNFFEVLTSSVQGWSSTAPHTFAVFLAEDAAEESKISFGGWEKDRLVEELSWNPVVDPAQGHWTVRIKALRINDEVLSVCADDCKGVVDTGTSLLAVPGFAFSEMYTLLKHYAPLAGHCHGPGPQLHIELDNLTITLGPEDYSRIERTPPRKLRPRFHNKGPTETDQVRTDLQCKPMLMAMDLPAPLGPKLFILGEPILRKYYSVYDSKEKRVGFARARHHGKQNKWLRPDMTPALKRAYTMEQRLSPSYRSMFDVFHWRKIRR